MPPLMNRLPNLASAFETWERTSLQRKAVMLIVLLFGVVLILSHFGAPSWLNDLATLLVASAIGSAVLRETAHSFGTTFAGQSAMATLFRPRILGIPINITLNLVLFALFWIIWKLDAIGWLFRDGGGSLLSAFVIVAGVALASLRIRKTRAAPKRRL